MTNFVEYSLLSSGIHYFTLLNNSVEASQNYVKQYNNLIQETLAEADTPTIKLRIILDLTHASLPPLEHMVAEVVENRRRTQTSGNRVICHFAYLSDDEDLRDKIERVSPIMSSENQRKIFSSNQQQEAIDWLLSL